MAGWGPICLWSAARCQTWGWLISQNCRVIGRVHWLQLPPVTSHGRAGLNTKDSGRRTGQWSGAGEGDLVTASWLGRGADFEDSPGLADWSHQPGLLGHTPHSVFPSFGPSFKNCIKLLISWLRIPRSTCATSHTSITHDVDSV